MEVRLLWEEEQLAGRSRQLQRQIEKLQVEKADIDERLQITRRILADKPEWENLPGAKEAK